MNKEMLIKYAPIVLVILGILGGAIYYFAAPRNYPVACTMEAKQCPDGSYVGRGGSNCEFSPCP